MIRYSDARLRFVAVLCMLAPCTQAPAVEFFPLQQVRLLESPFSEAQDRDIAYLMSMDVDRLLAPYLDEAGLQTRAPRYGNWESSGLGGHVGGHYLSALSLAWAATGRQPVGDRLDYMLAELRRAQQAHGNGSLGGVPNGDELWASIADGDIRANLFSLNDSWVPWYNLHKVFAGLRDAWIHAGREDARDMLVELADWLAKLVEGLNDEQLQAMLNAEHGGMNEVLADVADITDDHRYLRLAKRFSHRQLLDPLLRGEDRLTGMHANTQIPKVVGFERIAQLDRESAWHAAAEFFWDTVVSERSGAIGGHSTREHFHPRDDFSSMMCL
ncbi:MAG: glycoside hydrolase family 127 protein, partial [Gammaproteobacteria bacterium]